MVFKLELSQEQVELTIAALKKLPMDQVEGTVVSIVGQANAQLQAEQARQAAPVMPAPTPVPELVPPAE